MLRYIGSEDKTKADNLKKSPIMKKGFSHLGQTVTGAMQDILKKSVTDNDGSKSGGYTVFGMLLGENGTLSPEDLKFIWDHAKRVFGDTDYSKMYLGTMLMIAFAEDSRNWRFKKDDCKVEKLLKGEIPDATEYFLDKLYKEPPKATFSDLASHFKSSHSPRV